MEKGMRGGNEEGEKVKRGKRKRGREGERMKERGEGG